MKAEFWLAVIGIALQLIELILVIKEQLLSGKKPDKSCKQSPNRLSEFESRMEQALRTARLLL